MKKFWENPELDVLTLEIADVITASGDFSDWDDGEQGKGDIF